MDRDTIILFLTLLILVITTLAIDGPLVFFTTGALAIVSLLLADKFFGAADKYVEKRKISKSIPHSQWEDSG